MASPQPPPLFAPFRALGYITDDVPFAVQRRGKESFVTVSVGNAWQIYNCNKITLVLVGPLLPARITALAAVGDLTYAAVASSSTDSAAGRGGCAGDIHVCKRAHSVGVLRGVHSGEVAALLPLGDVLLSLGRADNRLAVWRAGKYDAPQRVIELPRGFRGTCLAHPDTYLNKVVVGGQDGRLQIWNFSTGRLVFESTALQAGSGGGNGGSSGEEEQEEQEEQQQGGRGEDSSAVCCIVPSPALDVVGVGMADGRAVLHNLKYDQPVVTFDNAAGAGLRRDMFLTGTAPLGEEGGAGGGSGRCAALSFRTGGGVPLLSAAGESGVVTIWNLEERRLHTVIRDAHDGPVARLHFFPGEPLLMSQGTDNSIKHWALDNADGTARLLRFRSGHAAPPGLVRCYGEEGHRLLSCGSDRAFRVFSSIQDQQSKELSQGHVGRRAKRLKVAAEELKLPPVSALDACQVRERDWCNVLTCHEGAAAAYCWRLQHGALGEAVLTPPPEALKGLPRLMASAPATACALSKCGNFGVVGSAAGRVDRYNMQSGLHRGVYQRRTGAAGAAAGAAAAGGGSPAHDGPVTGLAVDAANTRLVTAGRDGYLRVWDFKKRTLLAQLNVGEPITKLVMHAANGLVAVAAADGLVRVYDVAARRLVRRLRRPGPAVGCAQGEGGGEVTDLCISDDCRWLLASASDGSVTVWDVPASRVLQVLLLGGGPVTSLSLSGKQDMLATTHQGRRGIYLWSNQLLYGRGAAILPSEVPVRADLPTVTTGHGEEAAAGSEDDEGGEAAARANGGPGKRKGAGAAACVGEVDASGAPRPLAPHMVTLSLLPRTQWHTLVHLDVIKARSKPAAPPKKPEAAPFFLPSVAGLEGRPVFDPHAAATSDAPGTSGEARGDSGGGGDGAGADGVGSRILRKRGRGQNAPLSTKVSAGGGDGGSSEDDEVDDDGGGRIGASSFVMQLRRCARRGDWAPFTRLLRGLSPSTLDGEVRAMQVLPVDEDDADEEGGVDLRGVEDLRLLLAYLLAETSANCNFEFVQALLKLVLLVHGDTVARHEPLRSEARRLQAALRSGWSRLDGLLQQVRCMVGFFGNWVAT